MLQPRIVRSAARVSLAVGTLLNLINNGEQLWTQHSANLWQVALNFVVPYCVSSYSAARNEALLRRGGTDTDVPADRGQREQRLATRRRTTD